jgi:Zn/Cd-binding protein ZinT
MPAKSKSQQKAAGAALAAKRGDQKVSDLKGPAKSMYKSMSEGQLEEFASTKRKGKPAHASKKKK